MNCCCVMYIYRAQNEFGTYINFVLLPVLLTGQRIGLVTRTEHADLQTGLSFVCSTVFSRPADHLPEMSAVSMQLVCIKCAVRFYLVTER